MKYELSIYPGEFWQVEIPHLKMSWSLCFIFCEAMYELCPKKDPKQQQENDLYGSWQISSYTPHPGFQWEVKASVGIPYQKRKPSCWWLFCMEGAPTLEKGNMPWPKDHERPLLRSLVIEQTIRGWLSPHRQGTLHLDFLLCLKHTMLSTLDLWCLCRDKTHPHN